MWENRFCIGGPLAADLGQVGSVSPLHWLDRKQAGAGCPVGDSIWAFLRQTALN